MDSYHEREARFLLEQILRLLKEKLKNEGHEHFILPVA
jgi:hypothetical protein